MPAIGYPSALLRRPGFEAFRPSRRRSEAPKQRGDVTVKENLHPQLNLVTAVCACGNTFETHSTKKELRLEICSVCHPFFSGKQKLIDTAGRVERFKKRYSKTAA